MRAAVFRAPGMIEEVAEPRPRAGEVLVEVRGCGVCGSDVQLPSHSVAVKRTPSEGSTVGFVWGFLWGFFASFTMQKNPEKPPQLPMKEMGNG